MLFTFLAQAFGIWFVVSLLQVMVAQCRECDTKQARQIVPQKMRFGAKGGWINGFVANAAHLWFAKR